MSRKFKLFIGTPLIVFIIIVSVLLIYFRGPVSMILGSMSTPMQSIGHAKKIRNDLLAQDSFVKLLKKHEKKTLQGYRQTGKAVYTKMYLHRTHTGMFGLSSFFDVWQTWVRTDIVNGKPLTSFLVRLGVVKDENAAQFFGSQSKSDLVRWSLQSAVGLLNKLFDWGVLKTYRLNITEMDQTTSVGRKRISREKWSRMVYELHRQGKGRTFSNI
ncbi:hypothetical protein AKJ60_00120 [candidate division MSBL1 archaeon SCGC-AAA385M11]|nr:hypothetical protein AKJ60_00120 [candidate division MSBL1 archaeon SCGC-AAA385M11]